MGELPTITIMALAVLSVIWFIARTMILRAKCLTDEEIYFFVKGKIEQGTTLHQRMAGHLATCEKCRQQMHMMQFGKELEDHLVEDFNHPDRKK